MAIHVEIEGYDSLEQIGIGGMAAVYRARKISIDKTVAIKVLFPYLASDSSFIDRFQREAKAAASVQHENIVNVIDFGESGGAYYIVMEFYDGLTLDELLLEHQILPLDVAVTVLLDVCYGLEAAHEQNIVHRDIKPSNIIYTRQGAIKIADFGLAKKSDSMTMITQQGKVLGTPAYMSPEQAAGNNVGTRSDIFSFGVVFYELLSRQRPFEGKSYSEVLEKIQTYEPPALSAINPLVHPDFQQIVERMLQKDEARRYGSITDVIHDLEACMEECQISRDRRRLSRYIKDPEAYLDAFREKTIARCLSQGTFYMQKGQAHLEDAIIEFRRILHLDPENERARRHLDKVLAKRGKNATVSITAATPPEKSSKPARNTKAAPVAHRPGSKTGKRAGIIVAAAAAVAALGFFGVSSGIIPGELSIGSDNSAPVLSAPKRLTVRAGERVEFSLQAVDAEGDRVTFSASDLPDGATLNGDGDFVWAVDYDQTGPHEIQFRAEDGSSGTTVLTRIEVAGVANLEFTPISQLTITAGKTLRQPLNARSATGQPIEYSLENAPRGMKIEKGTIVWKPGSTSKASTQQVIVNATDGHTTESQIVAISVRGVSKPKVQRATTGEVAWMLPRPADIYLDGNLKKKDSASISLVLARGTHTLHAELPGGVTGWSQVVKINGGERKTIVADELKYGLLSVYFLGGLGEFRVNGRPFREQPPFSAIPIPVGTHSVSCRISGDDGEKDFTVTIKEGRETIVEYELGKEPAISIE